MGKGQKKEDFIFEIGTEELPSICLDEGIKELKNLFVNRLGKKNIGNDGVESMGTPRRLTVIIKGLNSLQDSTEEVVTGPPYRIAFDGDGNPTKAASGFARSNNANVKDLEKIETEKGDYLGITLLHKGMQTEKLLPDICKDVIKSISFSMQMTWSDYSLRFARPIRWLMAVYGGKIVDIEIESLKSSGYTRGHRTLGKDRIKIHEPSEYPELLEKEGKVIVYPGRRKEMIIDSIGSIEKKRKDFNVLIDEDLLEEVINLVEIPNVLVGSFPRKYLEIPREILIKAIQHHQRYFAVLGDDKSIRDDFLFVQNGIDDPDGEVTKGNERVLRARLSDALYFFEQDSKRSFTNWFEKLRGVIFYTGLGNIQDKSKRLQSLGIKLIEDIVRNNSSGLEDKKDIYKRSSYICKCDLVTNMVVEFPELQGIVGKEYARAKGEEDETSQAVFEHYLPRFAGDMLPSTDTGAILSLTDKLDTITGMFLADNIPTGSQDPFALRRKASGIILTVLDRDYDFDLKGFIDSCIEIYKRQSVEYKTDKKKLAEEIIEFILARQRFILEKKYKRDDIFDSISSTGCSSIFKIQKKFEVLYDYIGQGNPELLSLPMTRCKNIIKGKDVSEVDPSLFKESLEKELFELIRQKNKKISELDSSYGYEKSLDELIGFGKTVDRFFDEVLVMDKDDDIRQNRISLVKQASDLFMAFADFSKLIV